MAQRVFKTSEICSVSIGPVTLQGRIWQVQPPLPSPYDTRAQAVTYRAANTNKMREVEVYSNMRYAHAPVGVRRFAPPEMYTYPSGVHDASSFQIPPHQTSEEERSLDGRFNPYGDILAGALNWRRFGTKKSEDCLRVTVFRPRGRTNCPVVFHIHGGGWCVYHGMTPQHFGAFLAAHMGVVVVLVGYRLSTFGHLFVPGLSNPAYPSTAYLDQRTCLQWFNNVGSNFGADITRLLTTGSSAGGASTLLFLADPAAQGLFSSAWVDSGGGSGNYARSSFYIGRTLMMFKAIRAAAAGLPSLDPMYKTVQDAFDDGRDDLWVLQNAIHPEDIHAFADNRTRVTRASVKNAIAGTGALVTETITTPDNFYPYVPDDYPYNNSIEAAKAGAFTKPTVFSYAENEASVIAGNDPDSLRNYFNNVSTATLNGWAQRLGFNTFAEYAADWSTRLTPFGPTTLGEVPGSLFPPSVAGNALVEEKRTLYGHAVYGYPAWRMARAMKETNSAPAWLVLCNFGANGSFAGHSSIVAYNFGNVDWRVGLPTEEFTTTNPPGRYANIRMDTLYFMEICCRAYAKMAANGAPDGAYEYDNGFNLFEGNPPADGGALNQAWPQYNPTTQPGHHIVLGKYAGDYNNLNAIDPDLNSQRDAKLTFQNHMGQAYLDYQARLEP